MNQIGLFNSQENKSPSKEKNPKIQSNRPSNLNVSKIYSSNQKWRQCKIIGKNISIRSYSACCTFNNRFYVYGGYQILNGSLKDFYSISLDDNQTKFNWVDIQPKKGNLPGARSKHALVAGKSKIYLIGGLYQDAKSSNDIYQFNTVNEEWTLLNPEGLKDFPPLDSFGCTFIQKQNQQAIYIVGGYNDAIAQYSNAVYQFNITKNKLSVIFQGSTKQNAMSARSGCAATTDNKNLYIFGGKDEDNRMNDLWCFNLKDYKYQKLPQNGEIPVVRNGHTLNYFDDKLFVFGGIHDITWELDDLHIYNLVKKSWTTLEQDSPRKIQKKTSPQEKNGQRSAQKKVNKKKSWYQTVGNGLTNNKSTNSPMNKTATKNQSFNSSSKQQDGNVSPGKMIDQQRKKVFYQKKAEMLKNFEVNDKQKQKYVQLETSSQAMKNSLDVIGNPDGKANLHERLTDFGKQSQSKFLAPLQNNSNLVIGKKPCARDGHCSAMLNGQLIIFGGDRHQMSFNDIHKLNFKLAQKQIQK